MGHRLRVRRGSLIVWVSDRLVSDCVGLSWWLFFFFPFPIVGGDEVVGL